MLGGPVEVLLVEDNPSDIYLISAVLPTRARPIHISAVHDGESAIHFLERRGQYHSSPVREIILLDLGLPKLDGHEVLTYVKSKPALRHIPVVVLSGSDLESDIRSAYDLHANCYLTKPADLNAYFDLLANLEGYWLTQVEL